MNYVTNFTYDLSSTNYREVTFLIILYSDYWNSSSTILLKNIATKYYPGFLIFKFFFWRITFKYFQLYVESSFLDMIMPKRKGTTQNSTLTWKADRSSNSEVTFCVFQCLNKNNQKKACDYKYYKTNQMILKRTSKTFEATILIKFILILYKSQTSKGYLHKSSANSKG